MNSIDLLIFDCDGVLIDSEPLAARTLAQAVTRGGLPMTAYDVLVEFTGKSEPEIRAILEARGLGNTEAVFSTWHAEIFSAFRRELKVMPGMAEVLRTLDVAKCVASNSSVTRLKASLGLLDIWDDFAPHVYSAEMVAAPKPAPDLVQLCLSKMGVADTNSLLIDDSPAGIAAARTAGVRAIGFVAPGDPRPGRRKLLLEAGAQAVAFGAVELHKLLGEFAHERQPIQTSLGGLGN